MVEVDRAVTHIVPLTYGVMPRYKDHSTYRLTVDSALAVTAAQELYSSLKAQDHETEIFIPGATFFGNAIDAKYMKDHITHPRRPESHRVPSYRVTYTGNCLNTPTQLAEIKTRQDREKLGKIVLICASWQEQDARVLMDNYQVKGALYTDKEILYDNPRHTNTFDYQESTPTFRLKRDGLFAKIFRELNKVDKRGRVRVVITKLMGVGIADWEYRGVASNVQPWLEKRQERIMAQRRTR